MEILTELKLMATDSSYLPNSVTLRLNINGQSRVFPVQMYDNGLRAFDFPEELRAVLRQNPRVSQRLMKLLTRLTKQQIVAFPVNLLAPDMTEERQAA